MKIQRHFIPPIILTILILPGAAWYLTQPSNVFRAASSELRASGTIEAEQVAVTADMGGRVVEILAQEGETVVANAILARLDSESAAADLARAQAALAEAQARRDLAKNGARAEDKAQADAALAQALAARDGAKRAWTNSRCARRPPGALASARSNSLKSLRRACPRSPSSTPTA